MSTPLDAWRLDVPGIAAHRGGRELGPENTLVTVAKGLGAGATHLEVDVRGTADDVPVLMHDRTAERTCLDEGAIASMTLDEVKQLDPCRLWGDHADVATGERDPPDAYPRSWYEVPTLSELLEAFRGVPVILDLKDTAPPEAVAEAVDDAWCNPRDVMLAGYHDDILDATASRLPGAPRGAGRDGTEAFFSGGNPEADAILVPREHEGVALDDEEAIERAHDQGKAFWVWTINHREVAAELVERGVDGLITDAPGKLARERQRRLSTG